MTYLSSGDSLTSISIQISCLTGTGFGNDGKDTLPAYSLQGLVKKEDIYNSESCSSHHSNMPIFRTNIILTVFTFIRKPDLYQPNLT